MRAVIISILIIPTFVFSNFIARGLSHWHWSYVAIALKTETKNPNDIINASDITIIINYSGCFGGGTNTITINEENGKRTLTSISKSDYGDYMPKITRPFDKERETSLANLITAGISLKNKGYCTTSITYTFLTERYKCFFEEKNCSLEDYREALLK